MNRTKIVALLAATALVLAACGDDDSSTATEDTTTTVAERETTTEGDSEGTDVDEDALAGDLGECGFLAGFTSAFAEFDPTKMYSGEEVTDFGQLFAPLADATEDVAESAPEEIREAFRSVAEGFAAIAEELDGVTLDLTDPEAIPPETMAKLESLETAFGGEFEAAAREIDAWVGQNCGDLAERFDLDAFGS